MIIEKYMFYEAMEDQKQSSNLNLVVATLVPMR